jgi:hypothetical protein
VQWSSLALKNRVVQRSDEILLFVLCGMKQFGGARPICLPIDWNEKNDVVYIIFVLFATDL